MSRVDFFMNLQSRWKVKSKQEDDSTRLCGLVVSDNYAQRFVNGPPGERKTMEIRKTNFTNYLSEGDRILLISCPVRSTGRTASSNEDTSRKMLAILEYLDGFRIKNTMINQFYSAHRISQEEVNDSFGSWMHKQDHCFGLCFSLVHVFDEPIRLCGNQSAQIWNWVACHALAFDCKHDLRIARTDTSSSLGNTPATSSSGENVTCNKRSYNEMVSDPEKDITNLDEEQDEVNMDMEPHDDSKFPCLCVTETEWLKLRTGESCFLYRSYQCRTDIPIIVLVRKQEGHVVVGQMTISEKTHVLTTTKTRELAEQCQNMYSQADLERLKSNKSVWLWKVSAVDMFETPHTCKFLDMAPRFKNRPFYMSGEDLTSAVPDDIPRKLHLRDTGRFFVDLLSEERRQALFGLLRGLKNQVLRVGTTCSGTDVAVQALKELVNVFNEMEDCMDAY